MKEFSFQWRITLLTALLIAASCIILNLLLFHSGSYYLESMGEYVVDFSDSSFLDDIGEDMVFVELTQEQFDEFQSNFSQELNDTKTGFWQRGWVLTTIVTALSGVIAYFVSGRSLRPLRKFSAQAEQVRMENLTEARLDEDTIPEFRALSRSINQMLERLSKAFEAQRQFTGNAAHELRTPLALMQARLDLHEKECPTSSPETADTIALLREQTEHLSHLVKILLNMSELETIARTDRIELSPMIEEVLTDLTPLAEKNSVTLKQTGEALDLTGSDVLLYRVLFNLVENAIKYNRTGGSVTISAQEEDGYAVIRVCDTGPGIPEKHMENIFQPFYRVDKSRSRALGGVGLGLSLVWEIVRLHEGTVCIEESSEAGTTIVVTLPQNPQEDQF